MVKFRSGVLCATLVMVAPLVGCGAGGQQEPQFIKWAIDGGAPDVVLKGKGDKLVVAHDQLAVRVAGSDWVIGSAHASDTTPPRFIEAGDQLQSYVPMPNGELITTGRETSSDWQLIRVAADGTESVILDDQSSIEDVGSLDGEPVWPESYGPQVLRDGAAVDLVESSDEHGAPQAVEVGADLRETTHQEMDDAAFDPTSKRWVYKPDKEDRYVVVDGTRVDRIINLGGVEATSLAICGDDVYAVVPWASGQPQPAEALPADTPAVIADIARQEKTATVRLEGDTMADAVPLVAGTTEVACSDEQVFSTISDGESRFAILQTGR